MRNDRITIISMITQISFWVIVVLMVPIFDYVQHHSVKISLMVLPSSFKMMMPLMVPYFVNYMYLVPDFFFSKRKKWLFYMGNVAMILMNLGRLIIPGLKADLPLDIPFSRGIVNLTKIESVNSDGDICIGDDFIRVSEAYSGLFNDFVSKRLLSRK